MHFAGEVSGVDRLVGPVVFDFTLVYFLRYVNKLFSFGTRVGVFSFRPGTRQIFVAQSA